MFGIKPKESAGSVGAEKMKTEFDSMSKQLNELKQEFDSVTQREGTLYYTGYNSYYEQYRTNGYLQTIVDNPADLMTKEGFTVATSNGDESFTTKLNDAIKLDYAKHDLVNKINEALKWGRLYPEGSGLLPLIETRLDSEGMVAEQDLSKQMPKMIRKIKKFNVLSEPDDFNINSANTGNPKSIGYNEPVYEIGGDHVHRSRMIPILKSFSARTMQGISVVDYTEDALKAHKAAISGSTTILERLGAIVYQSDSMKLDKKNKMAMKVLLTAIRERLKSTGIFGARKDDEIELLTYEFKGIKDVFDFILDSMSGMSGIPKMVLQGRSPGGIISGDGANAELLQYYSDVESAQNTRLSKVDRYCIDLFMMTQESETFKITRGQEIPYTIDYFPIWSHSEPDMADMRKKNAKSDKIDYEIGKARSDELRELDNRYTGPMTSVSPEDES